MAIVNFCPILSYNRITFFIGGHQVLWTVFADALLSLSIPPEQHSPAFSLMTAIYWLEIKYKNVTNLLSHSVAAT